MRGALHAEAGERLPVDVVQDAGSLWGALTRFRPQEASCGRRVVRPPLTFPRSWFLIWSLCYLLVRCLLQLVLLRPRSQDFKELEIVVLRHELAVLRRQTRRPQLTTADRIFLAAASRLLPGSRWRSFLVAPTTLLRWRVRSLWSTTTGRRWRSSTSSRAGDSEGFHRSVAPRHRTGGRGGDRACRNSTGASGVPTVNEDCRHAEKRHEP